MKKYYALLSTVVVVCLILVVYIVTSIYQLSHKVNISNNNSARGSDVLGVKDVNSLNGSSQDPNKTEDPYGINQTDQSSCQNFDNQEDDFNIYYRDVSIDTLPTVKIADYIPYVNLYFAGKKVQISMSNLQQCFRVDNLQQVKAYLDSDCLTNYFKSNPLIQDKTYSLKGKDGKTVFLTKADYKIDYRNLVLKIQKEFVKTFDVKRILNGEHFKYNLYIQVPVDVNAPNTDGSVAYRYLEADGSRQLMFLWINGKYKVFKMSGAYKAYNPVGVYKILNKSTNAWSSIGKSWMPYWMAFTYNRKQHAMFGVHGLINWCPNREKYCEKKIYEPESNLGTPRSHGCLRLKVSDAKYVFDRMQVGDYLVVHD